MAVPTRSPSTWFRTKGDDLKVVDAFPFMLRVSKHSERFLTTSQVLIRITGQKNQSRVPSPSNGLIYFLNSRAATSG